MIKILKVKIFTHCHIKNFLIWIWTMILIIIESYKYELSYISNEIQIPTNNFLTRNCTCVLGLDSTFGGLEAMITALCDEYPRLLGRHRELFVAVLLTGIYFCSLPTCTYVSDQSLIIKRNMYFTFYS